MGEKRKDEGDRIITSWHSERPDLNVSPMELISRVTRLARHIDLARRRVFSDHSLETWGFDVLSSLRRAGSPYSLTPGVLMNELLVSSGTMTNRIDRLEQAGLVKRSPALTDRRVVTVTLTAAGKERVDEALIALLEEEEKILSPLSTSQRNDLTHLIRPLLLPFEK